MAAALRLVKANPGDYSLGDVLLAAETTTIKGAEALAASLSLYMQWPRHASALLYLADNAIVDCVLEQDPDEAIASILFVRMPLDKRSLASGISLGANLRIRFEVFRTCYEFAAQVRATAADSPGSDWDVVIEVPSEMTLFKHRRLPRVKVNTAQSHKLQARLLLENQRPVELNIVEMSVCSLVVATPLTAEVGQSAALETAAGGFSVTIFRLAAERAVLVLNHENGAAASRFFEVYRSVAYPSLSPRRQVNPTELLTLYRETEFLDRYQHPSQNPTEEQEILKTWQELDEHPHGGTADFVASDDDGRLVGASGLARAFQRHGRDVWFLNQLCARTEPNLLEQSGVLYQWRSEYLAARPEALAVVGRYWSGSRWLERVYTKFAMVASGVELIPIRTGRLLVEASPSTLSVRTLALGPWQRPIVDNPNLMAGLLPSHLNIVTALDAIFACWSSDEMQLMSVAAQLVASAGLAQHHVALAVRHQDELPPQAKPGKTDRLVFFDKGSLVDFLVAVDHIVAVTSLKYRPR